MHLKKLSTALVVAGLALPSVALATNGYFSHGYGMKAKGRAGASTAMADDAFAGAVNPAKAAFVGDRIDLGVDLFSPIREFTSTTGHPAGLPPGTFESDSEYFLVPEFGYNKTINPNLSAGVTVYGNGGMNSDYSIMGTSFGVDLMQLIIAPTLAYKINEQHSVGVSPLIGYQRFEANGVGLANNIPNPGYDDAFGWGARIGYMGKLSDRVTIGAAYSTKIDMEEMDKYNWLFAEAGDFDIPANWNIGVAFQATPQVKVALDYQKIEYGDVKSIANSSALAGGPPPAGPNAPGFGWTDIDVWKLGVEYAYSKSLTLRAGWNHGDNPIPSTEVGINWLAPGVVEDHITLGFTYVTPTGGEWTVAYMHAIENDVTDSTGASDLKIQMHQNSLGVAYSWKF